MSEELNDESGRRVAIIGGDTVPAEGPGGPRSRPGEADPGPRLRVRTIERVALVRFEDAEILFEDADVRAVREQLDRLVEGGHTRLLLNLSGVRYLSSDVLAVFAGLHREVAPSGGCIRLCGLDPVMRDMLRISRLDRLFDVCSDEVEALGLLVR